LKPPAGLGWWNFWKLFSCWYPVVTLFREKFPKLSYTEIFYLEISIIWFAIINISWNNQIMVFIIHLKWCLNRMYIPSPLEITVFSMKWCQIMAFLLL
jgi:hypothetical protein